MIQTFAELLEAFIAEEATKLAEFHLEHAPTIGEMYEGLSAELLKRAVPPQLELQVRHGFILDANGRLSGQIDCMLVRGDGERVPYTESHKWPISDVLAVFEVKKTLYGKELRDSFVHLRQVNQAFSEWLYGGSAKNQSVDITSALRAFTKITGIHAPDFKDREKLDPPLQLIYHTVVTEQLSPVSIVLGYGGYKSEKSLRDGFITFLQESGPGPGLGVPSFPSQITCNGFSLVKAAGQPYMSPMDDEYWNFYPSTRANPLWPMLELLWAKIENACQVGMPWGDDLEEEVFHRFLAAKPLLEDGKGGWMFRWDPFPDTPPKDEPKVVAWKPTKVDVTQFVIFQELCQRETVDLTEEELVGFLTRGGYSIDSLARSLQRTGLVARDGNLLRLSTQELGCVIAPDGNYYVGENNTGRLTAFFARKKDGR